MLRVRNECKEKKEKKVVMKTIVLRMMLYVVPRGGSFFSSFFLLLPFFSHSQLVFTSFVYFHPTTDSSNSKMTFSTHKAFV